jgi:hypothetical protein
MVVVPYRCCCFRLGHHRIDESREAMTEPTPTLSADQANAAIAKLLSGWPGQSMTDSERDDWRRYLTTKVYQGEFFAAYDAWLDGERSRYRPDVGQFSEVVRGKRAQGRHEDLAQATAGRLAELRAIPREDPEVHARAVQRCRQILRKELVS